MAYALNFVADEFDAEAMIQRFRERAQAVKNRPLPPVAGPEKKRFIERAQIDYMDFAMVGDATATLEDGDPDPAGRPAKGEGRAEAPTQPESRSEACCTECQLCLGLGPLTE